MTSEQLLEATGALLKEMNHVYAALPHVPTDVVSKTMRVPGARATLSTLQIEAERIFKEVSPVEKLTSGNRNPSPLPDYLRAFDQLRAEYQLLKGKYGDLIAKALLLPPPPSDQ